MNSKFGDDKIEPCLISHMRLLGEGRLKIAERGVVNGVIMQQDTNQKFERTDVIVVGAGPIGIELTIALSTLGIDTILIEARQIGATISEWPPATHFYSTPEHVALAGVPVHNTDQLPITGEQYLAYLRSLVEMFDLKLHNYEPVVNLWRDEEHWIVQTRSRVGERIYKTRYVVLCTGGLARPRHLGIPGEDLPHVSHRFPGPHPYFQTRVLMVGGKNSALESALRCWHAGASVAISYRKSTFDVDVIKPHLAMDIGDRLRKKEIRFFPSTTLVEISPSWVTLAPIEDGKPLLYQTFKYETDFVLLAIGFEADMSLFEKAGVFLQGQERSPIYDPKTMETNMPGSYVAGTAAGGTQERFTFFISTSHDHVAKVVKAITGRLPARLGTVAPRSNAVTWDEVKAN